MNIRRSTKAANLFVLAALFFGAALDAESQTWTGAISNNWNTAGNWSPAAVPGIADTVTIDNGSAINQPVITTSVTVAQINISAGSLTINSSLTSPIAQSGVANVTVGSGGSIAGNLTKSGTGTFSLNSGTLTGNISHSGGTVNAGSGAIIGSISSGSTFNGGSGTHDLTNLTITGGAFTPPTGTTQISGDFELSGGSFGASGGTVVFDGSGDSQINAVITPTFANLQINKSSGTAAVTVANGGSLTVTGQFSVINGNFSGGSGTLDFNGTISLTGGTFTATSGNTLIASNLTLQGGNFQANGGTVIFDGTNTSTVNLIPDGVLEFANVEINKGVNTASVSGVGNDTLRVNGTLTLTNGQIGFAALFEALGDVTIASTFDGGSGTLAIAGNATRTVTLQAPGTMPQLVINAPNVTVSTSGVGTLSFASFQLQNATSFTNGTTDLDFTAAFTQSGGTFNAGSGNLTFTQAFSQTNGSFNGNNSTLDFNSTISLTGGTFTATSGNTLIASNLTLQGGNFQANGGTVIFDGTNTSTVNLIPDGVLEFANVEINKGVNTASVSGVGNDTLRVNGTLTLTNGQIGFAALFEALGNVTIASTFDGGSGTLAIAGNATRTVTLQAPGTMPQLVINAPNVTVNTNGTGTISILAFQLQNSSSFTNGTVDVNFSSTFNQSGGVFNGGSGTVTFTGAFSQSDGTFNGGSGTLDFNGTISLTGGTFTATSGNTLIASNLTLQGGNFQANGGTVIFDGTNTSTVNLIPDGVLDFANVELNKGVNTAAVSGVGNDTLRVNGTLTLTNGQIGFAALFEALGNVTVGSTFDGGSGSITFGGPGNQNFQNNGGILPTGGFRLDKSAGTVNLQSDLDISNSTQSLTLANGTITTGPNTLILGNVNVSRTNGFIVGNLRRTYFAAGNKVFDVGTAAGYFGAAINATAGSFGAGATVTVSANPGALPGSAPSHSLSRHWTITPSAGGISQADVQFAYLNSDVPPTADESLFVILRRTAGTTTQQAGTLNTAANTATIFGVTQFSDWGIGVLAPTSAPVTIGGRVLAPDGRGIGRAMLTITDQNGEVRTAITNPFGYYRFDATAGQSYVISVASKSFAFNVRSVVVTPNDNIFDLDFVATPLIR